jgi:hypothetical protein
MNKILFEIREIQTKWIWIVLVFLIGVFIIRGGMTVSTKSGFLKFHGKEQYEPLNINSKDTYAGFYGKVNHYLEISLNDTFENQVYVIDSVNSFYQRLQFYCPTEGNAGYLVDKREIRLVGFVPDKDNLEEVKFFHNSNFTRLLEKQRHNLSAQFFKIQWKNGTNPRIKSITIDNTLGNVALLNYKWTGKIILEDPFSQIDPNVVYLIKDNIPIPLFTSDLPLQRFRASESSGNEITTIQNSEWNPLKTEMYEQMYQLLNNSDASNLFRVSYSSNQYLDFLNKGNRIFFSNSLVDVKLWVDGREQKITEQANNHFFTTSFHNVVKLQITNREGYRSVNEVIYVSKMPFRIASMLTNEGFAGKRTHVNENYCDLFTRQEIMYLESNLKTTSQKIIALTNNNLLSKVLEDEIKAYINNSLYNNTRYRWNDKDEFQMSFCLMDISTGEVIAAPFYSNRFSQTKLTEKDEIAEIKNFNLEFHHIGSTMKPLLAFAAVAKYPALGQFNLMSAQYSEDSCNLLGYTVTPYGRKKDGSSNSLFWSNNINRTFFLGHSHDNYPIALALLALTENTREDANAFNLLNTRGELNNSSVNNLHQLLRNVGTRIKYYPRKGIDERMLFKNEAQDTKIGESSFANLISNLYDIEMETRDRDNDFQSADTISWRHLTEHSPKLYALYPDNVNLGLDLIVNFHDFENFILGQGNNKWSNIKLAEAYSRLLSKRIVKATFLKGHDQFGYLFQNPSSLFNKISTFNFRRTELEMESAWHSFMSNWETAVHDSITGNTLNSAFQAFNQSLNNSEQESLNYHFYCKTGTPEEEDLNNTMYINGNKKIWLDEGLFVFGITNADNQQPKGLVGVVYIRHITECAPNGRKGIESSSARDFLSPRIFNKIMFYNQNRFNR